MTKESLFREHKNGLIVKYSLIYTYKIFLKYYCTSDNKTYSQVRMNRSTRLNELFKQRSLEKEKESNINIFIFSKQ